MIHEPFYVAGTRSDPELGAYYGWIAHEGSFAAGQNVAKGEGGVSIAFAGECFGEERDIIELYERKGTDCFKELDGLFSGLLVDKKSKKILLFNDRYGLDRIYWHEARDGFYFASEAKALLRVLPELRDFDQEGVAQFVAFGCTVNWRSLFRGIEILPGGSCWIFQEGKSERQRYFRPETWEGLPPLPEDVFQERFEEIFKRILPRYSQTERPVGIALTGGLDTRMILACAPKGIENAVSYTFTGRVGKTFDDRLAADIAKLCGLEHQLLRLGDDFFSDFRRHVDQTVYVTDGCFGAMGAHEIYFNSLARKISTVRLTGLFGSEILRGVSTFKATPLPESVFDPELEQTILASVSKIEAEETHPTASAAFRNIPWNLFGSLAAARSQVVLRSPFLDNELVALAFQTPSASRKSSTSALQLIARNNPLLAAIPTDRLVEDKGMPFPRNLRRAVREFGFKLDYLHNEGMPDSLCRLSPILDAVDGKFHIFGQHKFLHYRQWFRTVLSPYVLEVLTDYQTEQAGIWRRGALERMSIAHTRGKKNYVLALNTALTLEAVRRLLFRDLTDSPDPEQMREQEPVTLCR
jgi:asparagine synthase (glutamine-hydrolysing)